MKTNIYNESKDRNATATELARAIMNNAIEIAMDLTIADFQNQPNMIGDKLEELTEEQKEAVLDAMYKVAATLSPKTKSDDVSYSTF
jgi:hypothetical protein